MHQIPAQVFRTHESQSGSPRCVQHIQIFNHNSDSQRQQIGLAEVEVFAGGGNVAGGGTAIQGDKSQQTATADGAPENAIDGDPSTESLTDHGHIQRGGLWWKLDLGSEQDIDRIRITAPSTAGSDLEGAFIYARDSNYQILWSGRITGAADGSVHDFSVETCCSAP